MGRLGIRKKRYSVPEQQIPPEYMNQVPEEYYQEPPQEQYYQEPPPQYQQQYQPEPQYVPKYIPQQHSHEQHVDDDPSGFGDTRDPTEIARSVEDHPTPPGICKIMIGGRPIDLHEFEDYLVWKVSPYQIRTLLRYHNARTIEELKNYSLRPTLKMKSGTLVLIILAIVFLIGGLAVFMFMPEITAMFKGFV